MKKIINTIFLPLAIFGIPIAVYASSGRLGYILNHPGDFDKKVVTIEGEAIGGLLKGDDGSTWLNILDAGYNIGVYARSPDIFNNVKNFGSYARRGDIIKIRGVFYKNCPLHAERDIHAVSVKIVQRGHVLRETVPKEEEHVSFVLSIICLTLAAIYFIKLGYAGRH